jgi:hypothetical protein
MLGVVKRLFEFLGRIEEQFQAVLDKKLGEAVSRQVTVVGDFSESFTGLRR